MALFVWAFLLYILLIVFVIYVVICGNNKFHRDGCIGWWFRLLTLRIPDFCNRLWFKIFPCLKPADGQDFVCIGKNGPCRYFIAIFFMFIYAVFTIVHFLYCWPNMRYVFPELYPARMFLSIFVLPWPWVIFVMLQFIDPGEVTKENVESYLKAYPYDNVLYRRKICPTLKIPAPARSRYCRYTCKRIAKYDHYCPWVLAPIGAKTHRWFLCFLIFDTVAALYLSVTQIEQMAWRINILSPRIRWRESVKENALLVMMILFRTDLAILATTFVLLVIVVTLVIFIFQQMYFISCNKTQIELDKIDDYKEFMSERGDTSPYVHFYDHGFLANWKEFLFPPKIEKHKPMDYSKEIAQERKKHK